MMKRTTKRRFKGPQAKCLLTAFMSLLFGVIALTACTGTSNPTTTAKKEGSATNSGQSITETLTIGVIQFAHHASLDNCYEGLLLGLTDAGFTEGDNLVIDHQIANADPGLANQIAQNMVSRKVDLIVGIATPAAQAAYNAANEDGIPVLFTAVTDPLKAGLRNEDGSNLGGLTGTSDMLPVDAQLRMIRAFFPEAKNIGILYSLSESNSLSAIETYEELAAKYNFNIVTEGVSEASVIPAATDALLAKVDVLTNLTDNLVVENMPVLLNKATAAAVPLFGSEEEQVKNGGIAAMGINYIELGRSTGKMGAEILKGKAAESIPIQVFDASLPFHNSIVMAEFGIELPADYENSTDMSKP